MFPLYTINKNGKFIGRTHFYFILVEQPKLPINKNLLCQQKDSEKTKLTLSTKL